MGINFLIGCKKCKERAFMLRRKESNVLHDFFKMHESCYREDNANLLFGDDQVTEADWMYQEREGGYKEVELYLKYDPQLRNAADCFDVYNPPDNSSK